jgi:hypothetical protein
VRERVGEGERARGDAAAVELADAEGRDVALQDAPTSAPTLTNEETTRARPTAAIR